ncbi:MAG: hypothetical protein UHD09_03755 [Bifidobacterium sp.]|nr:hypothetical protein [Bifidobacterium sp.]
MRFYRLLALTLAVVCFIATMLINNRTRGTENAKRGQVIGTILLVIGCVLAVIYFLLPSE